jgi:hypothetical protein
VLTQTDAQLNALINANYQTTEFQFKVGTSTSYTLATVPAAPGQIGAGFGPSEVGVDLHAEGVAALTPNTEYHYEVVAKNTTGTSEGLTTRGVEDKTFVTLPDPPTVTTGSVTAITPDSATIAGTVNPGAGGHSTQDETNYYFQYGHTTSYGGQAPFPTEAAGEGTSFIPETANLAGLEPGSAYHYRIVATNLNDAVEPQTPQTVYGEDRAFTTPSTPPALTGIMVSNITQSTATITATLQPNGLATRYELQLGATPGALDLQAAGDIATPTPLTLTVTSLTPGTLYYYKLIASNLNGTSQPEGTFTTPAAPIPTSPIAQPLTPPLIGVPPITFPGPPKTTPHHKETKAEKLAKALKACRKTKNKHKRGICEKQAHKKYRATK